MFYGLFKKSDHKNLLKIIDDVSVLQQTKPNCTIFKTKEKYVYNINKK